MKKLFAMISAALILLTGCQSTPKRYSAVYTDVFDTITELNAYCASQEEFDLLAKTVHAELLRLHKIFDIYNSYEGLTNAKTLNDIAGEEAAEVPAELLELTECGKLWHSLSGGRLNIAMGSVLSLWHDCREAEILPDGEELFRRAEHCNISDIVIDGETVRLADPDMSLDFGALAKGYAAQKAAEAAVSAGGESFILSVGGNVVTQGEKPTGKWEVGIENPDGGLLTTVKVSGEAVVTSGDYQRYFEADGVRYHHIIDFETLYPAKLWRSVTVIAQSSAEADALSTALFCMSFEEGRELLKQYAAEALWVSADGEIIRSEGFEAYEK